MKRILVPTQHMSYWQKGIDENWAAALEYNPEAFARVVLMTASFLVKPFFFFIFESEVLHLYSILAGDVVC